jgi:hypothetical protein
MIIADNSSPRKGEIMDDKRRDKKGGSAGIEKAGAFGRSRNTPDDRGARPIPIRHGSHMGSGLDEEPEINPFYGGPVGHTPGDHM